jgi:hypothetical protein
VVGRLLRSGHERVPFTGGEKESLQASMDRHRDAVLWKAEGLDDEALRRPMTPSGKNLPGLVKHLAAVEYWWFADTFGKEHEELPKVHLPVGLTIPSPAADPWNTSMLIGQPQERRATDPLGRPLLRAAALCGALHEGLR